MINKNIKYLINQNPPNKKDKKEAEGEGWGYWIEVSDKGNYAIFNPYCYLHHDPLSLYVIILPLRHSNNSPNTSQSLNYQLQKSFLKTKMLPQYLLVVLQFTSSKPWKVVILEQTIISKILRQESWPLLIQLTAQKATFLR